MINFIVENSLGEFLLYETCINFITFFFEVGGGLWSLLGVIRLAGAIKDKNSPGLQGGIWQIFAGFAVIIAALLFRVSSFDFDFLIKILRYAGEIAKCAGLFWALYGIFLLAENFRNPNAPGLEAGIWQIVGGLLIFWVSHLFGSLISVVYV